MILKKKKFNENYTNIELLRLKQAIEDRDNILIEKIIQNNYKIGYIVDQTVAYGGLGNKRTRIKENNVFINYYESEQYVNISIGNVGIYNSKYGIFAKIISHDKKEKRE